MRNILFRGKRIDNDEWIYGNHIYSPDYTFVHNICDIGSPHDWYEVDPDTIEQFTGLYDKNGEKIFEGDVVKTKYDRLCVVVWFSSRAHCGWDLKPVDTVDNIVHRKPPTEYDLWEDKNLEVVGNIHDNPEFAEVE